MAEVKKIATRESYGNGLVELGKEHDNVVVLDADLAGATKTAIFKKALWYCRVQSGGCRRRSVDHGTRAVCLDVCHVCGGACL